MSRFAKVLRSTIPRPCFGRPFVCDGAPELCVAVVVGENPATEMGLDWWSYWDDLSGFNFIDWNKTYEERRLRRGKSAVSPTRLRLNRLRTHGVRCLETNVFFNERLNGPGQGTSNADLLDLVFEILPNIKFVIAHGNIAKTYIHARSIPTHIAKVFETKHLRLEPYRIVEGIAQEILAA